MEWHTYAVLEARRAQASGGLSAMAELLVSVVMTTIHSTTAAAWAGTFLLRSLMRLSATLLRVIAATAWLHWRSAGSRQVSVTHGWTVPDKALLGCIQ